MKKAIRQINENLKKKEDWIAWGFELVAKKGDDSYGMTAKRLEAWVDKHEFEGVAVILFARDIGMVTEEEAWDIERKYRKRTNKERQKARRLADIEERLGTDAMHDYIERHAEA